MVILLGAAAGLLLEIGAPGATIEDFGDALWWSGALVTTVGSEIYPVTTGARVLGFVLMLYAVGIFSYFIASIASVLVGADSQKPSDDAGRKGGTFRLDAQETATLRRILDRAGEDQVTRSPLLGNHEVQHRRLQDDQDGHHDGEAYGPLQDHAEKVALSALKARGARADGEVLR